MRRTIAVLLLVCAALIGYLGFSALRTGGGERHAAERNANVAAPPPAAKRHTAPPEQKPDEPKWRAVGTVTAADGSEITHGHVAIRMHTRELANAEFSGGTFDVELPRVPELARTLDRVVAVVAADGFLRGRSKAVALEPETRLDVRLERGAVVTGRVVDEAGRPVRDASVWFSPKGLGRGQSTNESGRFVLSVTKAAEHWICSRKGDVGVAVHGPVQLAPTGDHHAGDLVLRGPGVLTGIAVYPDGTPVRRMQMYAVPAEFKKRKITSWPGRPVDASKDPDAASGLRWGWTHTGDDGRFTLRGLRTGSYFFKHDKSRTLYETGSEARIVIDIYRILVHVRDEDGAPVLGMSLHAESDSASIAGSFTEVDAEPGDSWAFEIGSRTIQPAATSVGVVSSTYEYETTLVAKLVRERGRLRIRALDPRGVPIAGLRVTLHAHPSDSLILYEDPVDAEGLTKYVPAGRYRFEAKPGGNPFALFFPAEGEATVRDGGVTPITVQARAGGRVSVTFRLGDEQDQRNLGRPKFKAAPAHGGEPLLLGGPLRRRDGGGWSLGGKWKLNDPALCWRLLEPGAYELRIDLKGYEPLRLPLNVQPGVLTDVEARLAPVR